MDCVEFETDFRLSRESLYCARRVWNNNAWLLWSVASLLQTETSYSDRSTAVSSFYSLGIWENTAYKRFPTGKLDLLVTLAQRQPLSTPEGALVDPGICTLNIKDFIFRHIKRQCLWNVVILGNMVAFKACNELSNYYTRIGVTSTRRNTLLTFAHMFSILDYL